MNKKSKTNITKTHLTIEDRSKIEFGLNKGYSIRAISREIGKSPSSVLREIRRNCLSEENSINDCSFLNRCSEHHVCGNISCNLLCRKRCFSTCFKTCSSYEKRICDRLSKSPYVCNSCPKKNNSLCRYSKVFYSAKEAHNRYREILHERRAGFDLTLGELKDIDLIVSPLIKQGQSPYHIVQSNNLGISLSTLYRMVDSNELDAKNIDLCNKVSRKPRKSSRKNNALAFAQIRENKVGHMWLDFCNYMNEHDSLYVEMDCVVGKRNENPALLTIHYPSFHFQLAIYLPKHNSDYVIDALDTIETTIGTAMFTKMFPVILTDNGPEFSDVEGIEQSCLDPFSHRTKVFFCEPNRSDEKGACENNHKMIRRIIPKGTSLYKFNNYDITLMMNHINSYRRESAFGKSAFDLIENVFPQSFLDSFGYFRIPDNEIILSPKLFYTK